ncbi:MAG: hypothetical protein GY803_08950 [Chloroflexi bacterium]|nr:hypothetical protein [Chloroflexota bacterium]
MREQARVTRVGGMVSAIACFCHSGGTPHYHGRYPLPKNHRIDELDVKLDRIWRRTIRPHLLNVDHTILNMDLLWQFKNAGLQDVQINGHMALISPGDSRMPVDEGAAYALARHKKELDGLVKMQQEHGEKLITEGFSQAEFDELLTLKRERLAYLQGDPARVREVLEAFSEPLLIVQGRKSAY